MRIRLKWVSDDESVEAVKQALADAFDYGIEQQSRRESEFFHDQFWRDVAKHLKGRHSGAFGKVD